MANDEGPVVDEDRVKRRFPMRPGTRRVALVMRSTSTASLRTG
jgi:hypothetical protein